MPSLSDRIASRPSRRRRAGSLFYRRVGREQRVWLKFHRWPFSLFSSMRVTVPRKRNNSTAAITTETRGREERLVIRQFLLRLRPIHAAQRSRRQIRTDDVVVCQQKNKQNLIWSRLRGRTEPRTSNHGRVYRKTSNSPETRCVPRECENTTGCPVGIFDFQPETAYIPIAR